MIYSKYVNMMWIWAGLRACPCAVQPLLLQRPCDATWDDFHTFSMNKGSNCTVKSKWSLNLEGKQNCTAIHRSAARLSLRNRTAPGCGSKARIDHLITHEPAVQDARSRLTVNWFKLWEKLVGSPLNTSSKGLKDSFVYLYQLFLQFGLGKLKLTI